MDELETVTKTIQISFDDLMDAVENTLIYRGYIMKDEFLLWADLGIDVDDQGMVVVDIEVSKNDDIDEEPVAYEELVA